MIPEVRLKLISNKPLLDESLITPSIVIQEMHKLLGDEAHENFAVVYLNNNLQVLNYTVISQGSVTESVVSPAEIFKVSLLNNATKIMLFHNHPGGLKDASADDILITKKIASLAKLFDMEVVDHIIVTQNDFLSMRNEGLLNSDGVKVLQEINRSVSEFNKKYSFGIKEKI